MTEKMECPDCHGRGQHVEMQTVRIGQPMPPYRPCPRCDGAGEVQRPRTVQPLP
ncbi:zinc finger domain-containing protein [Bradyrhizobium quebecense]|uniref:zinc finger domain-containing protein n=1 Tax=Bradyrhizobium quebecense TaxID=2748629 RepID=UPI001C841B45